jgi:hypothetical protein
MFSIDSSSVKYLEYTSSLNTTNSIRFDLSNGGTISGSVISASALYAPSANLIDTYTPTLTSILNNTHNIAIDSTFPTESATANTIYKQWYVPANTFKPGDIIQMVGTYRHSGSANITVRFYVNSESSSFGTTLATNVDNAKALTFSRIFAIRTNNTVLVHGTTTADLQNNQVADVTNLCATVTIPNLTGSTYWNIALTANAASTQSFYSTTLQILGRS